jgi:hypothetical protein
VQREPPGDNCADGGILVEAGIDENDDGELDDDEVDSTSYVCDGADGAHGETGPEGPASLIAVTAEAAGDTCEAGGQRIDYGVDADSDGVLDTEEVSSTGYLCDGAEGVQGDTGSEGLTSLIAVTAEAAGDNCETGGQRIDHGLDADADGVLDAEEISGTSYLCDGADGVDGAEGAQGETGSAGLTSLIAVTAEAAGDNC